MIREVFKIFIPNYILYYITTLASSDPQNSQHQNQTNSHSIPSKKHSLNETTTGTNDDLQSLSEEKQSEIIYEKITANAYLRINPIQRAKSDDMPSSFDTENGTLGTIKNAFITPRDGQDSFSSSNATEIFVSNTVSNLEAEESSGVFQKENICDGGSFLSNNRKTEPLESSMPDNYEIETTAENEKTFDLEFKDLKTLAELLKEIECLINEAKLLEFESKDPEPLILILKETATIVDDNILSFSKNHDQQLITNPTMEIKGLHDQH